MVRGVSEKGEGDMKRGREGILWTGESEKGNGCVLDLSFVIIVVIL